MVRVSYEQKPYRRLMMQTWGAECVPSPSPDTEFGRQVLKENPASSGSLGIAISEAIEDCLNSENTRYSLGSVLNHVLLHQTIIGLEAQKQLAAIGEYPDIIAGCVGGGSNFGGLAFPFIRDKIYGREIEIYAVEPAACPTMTKGSFVYDFGDTAAKTPLLPMFSLGHGFIPAPIHAGGLRYHGTAPLISRLLLDGLITPAATTSWKHTRQASSGRAPRDIYPPRKPTTPSPWPSTRHARPRKRARRRQSLSAGAGTASWTFPATTPTCRGSSPAMPCPTRRSPHR